MRAYDNSSRVEEIALAKSARDPWYPPSERIKIIEVPDFPRLGRLTALRFLEWLVKNPEGTVSLPTGKTPEHFITWTARYLSLWNEPETAKELAAWGIEGKRPDMRSFPFVQIDEFFPMDPAHENSFSYYIKQFYLKNFGFDPRKALLMDTWTLGAPAGKTLGDVFPGGAVDVRLRYRQPANETEKLQYSAITAADQWAMKFEERIGRLGGIGFFLGGIGPDGHIGFNIRGSDHFATTRLIPINYETAAAAAGDLGGIEISRTKVVMTIGLKTITANPGAVALIIATGENKAKVVHDAVEKAPSVLYPATALQKLPGTRFYLTKGATALLTERRYRLLAAQPSLPSAERERIVMDVAVHTRKRLADLETGDLAGDRFGTLVLRETPEPKNSLVDLTETLKRRIRRGLENPGGITFLHTAPHHDDIMLGYLPAIIHLVRNPENTHYFATMTSGFTSVTNAYTLDLLKKLERFIDRDVCVRLQESGYFAPGNTVNRNRDVFQYLDGVAADSPEMREEAESRRMVRNLAELAGTEELKVLRKDAKKIADYLATAYPGKKDEPAVQTLKGMIREWEEELLWAHLGFNADAIIHLRLGFYTGDIFTPQPEWERDVKPVADLFARVQPDIVTVALDPEGSGPDTHYKVLQAIATAVEEYNRKYPRKNVKIWGYRNVWHRFHPAEANIYVPVSMNSFAIMKSAFHTCFGSQRSASFPSHEYDGPFCDLAQKIMVEQYTVMKTCLGRDCFFSNPVPRLRATRGLNFLKEMTCEEFTAEARTLKKLTENR